MVIGNISVFFKLFSFRQGLAEILADLKFSTECLAEFEPVVKFSAVSVGGKCVA